MAQRTPHYNLNYLQFGDKWYPGIDYENMLTVENQLKFAASFIGPCVGIGWSVDLLKDYREDQLQLIGGYLENPLSNYGKAMSSMALDFDLICAAGSTGNINLVSPPTAIDGITLQNDDKVLVRNQSSAIDNGVYSVVDAGAGIWTRDIAPYSNNFLSYVQGGISNTSTLWIATGSGSALTFGSNPIYFVNVFEQCVKVFPGNGIVDIYFGKTETPKYFRAKHEIDHYLWADASTDMTYNYLANIVMPEPAVFTYGKNNNSTYLGTIKSSMGSTLYDLPTVDSIFYGENRRNFTDSVGEIQQRLFQNYITHRHLGDIHTPEKINLQTSLKLNCLPTYNGETKQSSSVLFLYNTDGSLFVGNFNNYGIPKVYFNGTILSSEYYRFELDTSPCKIYLQNSIEATSEILVELPLVNQKELKIINSSGILVTSLTGSNGFYFLSDGTLEDRSPSDNNAELVYSNFSWSETDYLDLQVFVDGQLVSPKHYDIHPTSGRLALNSSFPSLGTITYDQIYLLLTKIGNEVKNSIPSSKLSNINAETFTKGQLHSNQIDGLSHNFYMRYKEKANYTFNKLLISGNGNSSFYPEKTDSQLQYNSEIFDIYESVNFGDKPILYGTTRGLLNSKDDFLNVEIIRGWNNDIGRPAKIIDNLLRPENENIFHATYMSTLEGEMFYTKDKGASWTKRKLPYDEMFATKYVSCFDVSSDKYLVDENTYKESLFIYMGSDTGAYYAQVFKNMPESEWEWKPVEFLSNGGTLSSIANINDIKEISTRRIDIEINQPEIITYDRSLYVGSSDPDNPGLYAGNQYIVNKITDDEVKGIYWLSNPNSHEFNNLIWWDDYNVWMTHTARHIVQDNGSEYYEHPFTVLAGSYTDCECATTENITLSGLQTIDGYSTFNGDRVLVKNQTDPTENGIYVANSTSWSRSSDLNSNDEFIYGKTVEVLNGDKNAGNIWFLNYLDQYDLGTSEISWSYYKVLMYSTTTPSYTAVRSKIKTLTYRNSNLEKEQFILAHTDGIVLITCEEGNEEHPYTEMIWEAPSQGKINTIISVKDNTADGIIYVGSTEGLYKSTSYFWIDKDNITDISIISNAWSRVQTVISPLSQVKLYDIITGNLVENYIFYPQWQLFKFNQDYDIGSNLYYETSFNDFYIEPWYDDLLDDNGNIREHRVVVYIDNKPCFTPYYTDSKTGLIRFVSGIDYTKIDKVSVSISANDIFISNVGDNAHTEIFMGVKKGSEIAKLSKSNSPNSSVLYLNQDINTSETVLLLEDGVEQEIVYVKSINNFLSPTQVEIQFTREKAQSSKTFPIGSKIYSIKDSISESIENKIYHISSKENYNLGSLNNYNHNYLSLELENNISGLYDKSPSPPIAQDDNRGLKNLILANDFVNSTYYDANVSSIYATDGVPREQFDDDFEIFNVYDIGNLSTNSLNSIIITDRGFWFYNGFRWENFYLTNTATCNFIRLDEDGTYKVGCNDGLYIIDTSLNVIKNNLYTQQITDYMDGFFDGEPFESYAKSDGVVINLNYETSNFVSEYISCVDGSRANSLYKTTGTRLINNVLTDYDLMFVSANNGFHAVCKQSSSDVFSTNFTCKTVISKNPEGVSRYIKSFSAYQIPSIPANNKQINTLFILTNDGILKTDNYKWVDPCSATSPELNITDRFLRGLECLSYTLKTDDSPDGVKPGKSKIFIGTNKGVYRSIDNGNTFEYTNRFDNKFPIVYSLRQFTSDNNENVIVACTNDGLWYTIDDGDNWYRTGHETEDNELPIICDGLPENHIPWANDITTSNAYASQTILVPITGSTIDKVACHIHSSSFYTNDVRYQTSLENNVIYAYLCDMNGIYPDQTNILETSSTTYTPSQINNNDELTFFDFNYTAFGGQIVALVLHEVVTPGGISLMEWQKVNQTDYTYGGKAFTYYDGGWSILDDDPNNDDYYQYNFRVYYTDNLSITQTQIAGGCSDTDTTGWEQGTLSGLMVNFNGELILDTRFLISLVVDDTLSMSRLPTQQLFMDKLKEFLTVIFQRTARDVSGDSVNFSAVEFWTIRDTIQKLTYDGFTTDYNLLIDLVNSLNQKGNKSNLMDGVDIASNSLFHNSINKIFTDVQNVDTNIQKISNLHTYCENNSFTRNPWLIDAYNALDEVDSWNQNSDTIPQSLLASKLLVDRFSNTYIPLLMIISDGENISDIPISKIIENSKEYWDGQGFRILFFDLNNLDFQAQFHRISIEDNGYHFQAENNNDWNNIAGSLLHGGSKNLFKGNWSRIFTYEEPIHVDKLYTSYTNPGFGSNCKVEFKYSTNNKTFSDWIELTSGVDYKLNKKIVYLEYRINMEEGWDGTNRYAPSVQKLYHVKFEPASFYIFSDLIETDGYINEYILTSSAVGLDELDIEFGICRGDSLKWKNYHILNSSRNSILPQRQKDYKTTQEKNYNGLSITPIDTAYFKFNILYNNSIFTWNSNSEINVIYNGQEISNLLYRYDNNTGLIVFDNSIFDYSNISINIKELPSIYLSYGEKTYTDDFKRYFAINGPWINDDDVVVFVNNEIVRSNYILDNLNGSVIFSKNLAETDIVTIFIQFPNKFRIGIKVKDYDALTAHQYSFALQYTTLKNLDKVAELKAVSKSYLKDNRVILSSRLKNIYNDLSTNYVVKINYDYLSDFDTDETETETSWWIRKNSDFFQVNPANGFPNYDNRLVQRQKDLNGFNSYFETGDEIYVQVQPRDKFKTGNIFTSEIYTLTNYTKPYVTGVIVKSSNNIINNTTTSGSILSALYTYVDIDVNVDNSIITWYDWSLNNPLIHIGSTLPSEYVISGKIISYIIRPFNGISYGNPIESNVINII